MNSYTLTAYITRYPSSTNIVSKIFWLSISEHINQNRCVTWTRQAQILDEGPYYRWIKRHRRGYIISSGDLSGLVQWSLTYVWRPRPQPKLVWCSCNVAGQLVVAVVARVFRKWRHLCERRLSGIFWTRTPTKSKKQSWEMQNDFTSSILQVHRVALRRIAEELLMFFYPFNLFLLM